MQGRQLLDLIKLTSNIEGFSNDILKTLRIDLSDTDSDSDSLAELDERHIDLDRQEETEKQEELERQKEIRRQIEIDTQKVIDRQKNIDRQIEIDQQEELDWQTEIENQAELARRELNRVIETPEVNIHQHRQIMELQNLRELSTMGLRPGNFKGTQGEDPEKFIRKF